MPQKGNDMNSLFEKNLVQEKTCGTNFAYILNDSQLFLSTEYKVLQSQGSNQFLKCMKMLYNGKIMLLYSVDVYRSLASMLPSMQTDSFFTIIANLFSVVIEAKSNGFLSCRNIEVAADKIFVDPPTGKVRLVYVPFSERFFADQSAFETELRTSIIKIIDSNPCLISDQTKKLSSDLSDGNLSVEELYIRMKSLQTNSPTSARSAQPASAAPRLVSVNSPVRLEIRITKNEFLLGKIAGSVDGVIEYNKAISRVHCKICRNGSQYTIADLGSANGTFVNKEKLPANQPQRIVHGDMIRLANSDFQFLTQ